MGGLCKMLGVSLMETWGAREKSLFQRKKMDLKCEQEDANFP